MKTPALKRRGFSEMLMSMSMSRSFSLLALAVMLGTPAGAFAQTTASPAPTVTDAPAAGTPATGHHRHRHRGGSFMRSVRGLDLTDAQKQQIATFHSQEQTANQNADAATKQDNARKLRMQIMGILTPEQKAKLAAEHHPAAGAADAAPGSGMASPAPQH